MYIFKQPHIGGEVTCHQDSSFLDTETPSLIGLWIALEDATLDNGCLWGIPGGHKGSLRSLYIRQGDEANLKVLDETPWEMDLAVPLTIKKGSVLFFDGRFPHFSHANRSDHSRDAYVLHIVDGKASPRASNWLRRAMPTRGF
jgi:phytanoyl-CoA hydroxylase